MGFESKPDIHLWAHFWLDDDILTPDEVETLQRPFSDEELSWPLWVLIILVELLILMDYLSFFIKVFGI